MHTSYDKKDEVAQSGEERWEEVDDGQAVDLTNRKTMARRILLNLDFR
jgi:hypothetical protein